MSEIKIANFELYNYHGSIVKRTAAILFLLSLFAPLFLASFYINIKIKSLKKDVRERIESGMEESDLSLMTFSVEDAANNIEWEDEKEFKYEGIMYDIVKSDTVGNLVMFWCYEDHRESDLNRQLEELSEIGMNKDPVQKENHKRISNFLKCLYFDYQSPTPLIIFETDIDRCNLNAVFESRFITPPDPPPISV